MIMDEHKSLLQEVCRVGGRKFSCFKQSTRYSVEKYSDLLKSVHGIDISKDCPDIHPPYICILCERALKRASRKADHCGGGCGPVTKWEPHHRTNCSVCASQKKRGASAHHAKPKTALRGAALLTAPSHQSDDGSPAHAAGSSVSGLDISAECIQSRAARQHRAILPLDRDRFLDRNAVQICIICKNAADGILETACCNELSCAECISEWLSTNNTCKSCSADMAASSMRTPSISLVRVVSSQSIHCDFHEPSLRGCPEVVPLHDLQRHVNMCPFNPAETPSCSTARSPPPSTTPIRSVRPSSTVAEVLSASPSKLKGNVATNLTARLVTARAEGGRLEVKTGEGGRGKPQVYQLTPECSVPSTDASASTLKRRAAELTRIAESVCGGSDGARVQMIAGLKRLSSAAQEELLQEAGLKCSSPSPGTALAIKADLRLPWSQLRKLRQWLKVFGVKLESERSIREFIAKTLPSYTATELPMSKRNGDVSMAATVFFPDLVAVVMHFLDILNESDSLTWHSGTIPQSEVWLKIGGDHGGGNFKLSLQIANVLAPNATHNTIPLCIFEEKDTPANLKTALGQYAPQIEHLQSTVWNGRQLRVYMFGDYEFQTMNYGLSGSGGLRPCLHCLCPKKEMANPNDDRTDAHRQARTLTTLADDYGRFSEAGSQISQAKHYNNVIRPCILPVPVENAIIPVLHLDLGIYTWMFEALLKDLQELDSKLASKCNADTNDAGTFTKLCALHEKLRCAQLQLDQAVNEQQMVQQQMEFSALHIQNQAEQALLALVTTLQQSCQAAVTKTQQHTSTVDALKDEIAKLCRSKDFSGPCVASVEPVLQHHKIERQVYHGGAFIGNHVHQALKPTVVAAISHAHVPVITSRCPVLAEEAQTIASLHENLMNSYASCRAIFSHSQAVSADEMDKLESEVRRFLSMCRRHVVARRLGNITPKLHLLENHTVPLIRKLGVGLGLLAEQGAESLHASLNTLNAIYKNIPGDLARLKVVAEQHLLTTTKEASTLAPRPQKRKAEDQGPVSS